MVEQGKQQISEAETNLLGRFMQWAWWRQLVKRVLRVFLFSYVVLVVLLMLMERRLVYPRPSVERGNWDQAELGYEEVHFAAADGVKLHGWYFPVAEPRYHIVYFHGNGEDISSNGLLAVRLCEQLQASLFLFDYRGYGQSQGKPHQRGVTADGRAATAWLAAREGIGVDQLVLIGRSLGGGVAVQLAAESGARALILQNTFSSLPEVAARKFPWLPVRLLMRNRFNSVAKIGSYQGPVFQCHSRDDGVVPFALAEELYAAISHEQRQFVEMADRGHNGPLPESYYQQLQAFLAQMACPLSVAE